ncbi:MAG: C25 family cysteine peptidase [Candidatus Syntrophosphaera sp.]
MNKLSMVLTLLCLPLMLLAAELTISLDLMGFDPSSDELPEGWGSLTAPGHPQLPVKTVNIILPPDAQNLQYSHQFSSLQILDAPAPVTNPPFSNGEISLPAAKADVRSQQVQYLGIKHWGDIAYASFRVLPAIYSAESWQVYRQLHLNLSWNDGSDSAGTRIPPVLSSLAGSPSFSINDFFANPGDLGKHYTESQAKNYDYLIVSTPELYSAIAPLETYRQGQGMITAFADISTILTSSPGNSDGEKLRNYLIGEYNSHPFTYLLLVGDHDTVPVMYLTPEPDGWETVASDFFYGDLSSVADTDGDGRVGEYSPGNGLQDFLCDFTPEVFVGRISTNSTTIASQIASRTVSYEQTSAPWKQHALLPAAYLNYQGEPETIYLQTDGATFMEYARNTVLEEWQCTTMYEQLGVVPSYPSDHALDYNQLKNLLNTNSYGILNWSAHGSAGSSSRKVWMNDDNGNNLPDGWEMNWVGMVNRESFDNLANDDGLILFAASCYNGYIDYNQPCLAEYALQKKAVNVSASTRTGWYKIGWETPGWGGLSSYNLHWLENITRNQMSVGAAHAHAGLTHTQYYLFGDPVDAGGIIYPELQNVYTNLLYGDPAVGHTPSQEAPLGEILVYEPLHDDGLPVVNAINSSGQYNVIYTDKLIPDYDYIHQFEAIFCLFGWGDSAYILDPDSLDYTLLDSYLNGGGRIYLEGDVAWNPADFFWHKFGTHAPLDIVITIEGLESNYGDQHYAWLYDQTDPQTYVPLPCLPTAASVFFTNNTPNDDYSLAVHNSDGNYVTIASAFALSAVQEDTHTPQDMLTLILEILYDTDPVEVSDEQAPPLSPDVYNHPNPFVESTSLHVKLEREAELAVDIFNLRGQKVRSLRADTLPRGEHDLLWDGRDSSGRKTAPGIYFWRLRSGDSTLRGKMLKLAN